MGSPSASVQRVQVVPLNPGDFLTRRIEIDQFRRCVRDPGLNHPVQIQVVQIRRPFMGQYKQSLVDASPLATGRHHVPHVAPGDPLHIGEGIRQSSGVEDLLQPAFGAGFGMHGDGSSVFLLHVRLAIRRPADVVQRDAERSSTRSGPKMSSSRNWPEGAAVSATTVGRPPGRSIRMMGKSDPSARR